MKEPKHPLSGFETYFVAPGAGKTILSFKNGAVIYSQDDPAESIFYIQKGRVRLGKEAVVSVSLNLVNEQF
jgi:CRP/FNR family cyclic AMP-dependent transcriptional regulator